MTVFEAFEADVRRINERIGLVLTKHIENAMMRELFPEEWLARQRELARMRINLYGRTGA